MFLLLYTKLKYPMCFVELGEQCLITKKDNILNLFKLVTLNSSRMFKTITAINPSEGKSVPEIIPKSHDRP